MCSDGRCGCREANVRRSKAYRFFGCFDCDLMWIRPLGYCNPCWPRCVDCYRKFSTNRHLIKVSDTTMVGVASHREILLARIRCGVGRGNKFVLLDMTEEPEAKKSLQYTTQTKFNETLRRQGYRPRNADSPWRLKGAESPVWISSPFLMKFWKLVTV